MTAKTSANRTHTDVRLLITANQSAGNGDLVRAVRGLRNVLRAFLTSIKPLREWLLKTHFFAVPTLSAPALTVRIDDARTRTATPNIFAHLSSFFQANRQRKATSMRHRKGSIPAHFHQAQCPHDLPPFPRHFRTVRALNPIPNSGRRAGANLLRTCSDIRDCTAQNSPAG